MHIRPIILMKFIDSTGENLKDYFSVILNWPHSIKTETWIWNSFFVWKNYIKIRKNKNKTFLLYYANRY